MAATVPAHPVSFRCLARLNGKNDEVPCTVAAIRPPIAPAITMQHATAECLSGELSDYKGRNEEWMAATVPVEPLGTGGRRRGGLQPHGCY
jgi:hypothetical protein